MLEHCPGCKCTQDRFVAARLDIWKAASGALTAAKWDDIAETGNYFTDLDEADAAEADAAEDDEDDEDGDEEETTGGEDETEDP